MISTIIQLFAILLLAIVLYRETKRDRLAELRRREELQDLFREQEKTFHTKLGSVTSSIKAQIELTYTERFDSILKRLEYFGELIEVYVTQDAISMDEFTRLHKCVSDNNTMLSQIRVLIPSIKSIESIESIQSTTDSTHSELIALKPLIQDLIKARTQNTIKEGEANRTLRRRIQEKDAVLASTRQTIKAQELRINEISSQITETRDAAKAALEHAISEINAIRSWMEERGIPTAPLDKHLAIIFKAGVPSAVYQRISNQDALKEAIGGALTHLHAAATGRPLDAASNAATN